MKILKFLLLPLAYACIDPHMKRNGSCVAVKDCDGDWSFGTTEKPICDVPGADYQLPTTKICCLEPTTPAPSAEPEAQEPEVEEPEAQEPEAQAQEPEAQEPEAQEPEAQEPEAQEPKAQEPEAP